MSKKTGGHSAPRSLMNRSDLLSGREGIPGDGPVSVDPAGPEIGVVPGGAEVVGTPQDPAPKGAATEPSDRGDHPREPGDLGGGHRGALLPGVPPGLEGAVDAPLGGRVAEAVATGGADIKPGAVLRIARPLIAPGGGRHRDGVRVAGRAGHGTGAV